MSYGIHRVAQYIRLCMWPALVLVAALMVGAPVEAGTLTATDSGFVTAVGGSAKGDGTTVIAATADFNYSVGFELHYSDGSLTAPMFDPLDRNNYFVFDMTGESGTIVDAKLELYTGMLESVDGVETFDVVAPGAPGPALADADALLTANGVGSTEFDMPIDPAVGMAMALYGNIEGGVGMPLGTAIISSADDFSTISIPLVGPGLAYLNGFVGSRVILGGSVSSIDTGAGTAQQPFGFTDVLIPLGDPLTPKLVLTFDSGAAIPEPSTCALMALAVAVLLIFAGRRRNHVC